MTLRLLLPTDRRRETHARQLRNRTERGTRLIAGPTAPFAYTGSWPVPGSGSAKQWGLDPPNPTSVSTAERSVLVRPAADTVLLQETKNAW